jgi:hypothetical protein
MVICPSAIASNRNRILVSSLPIPCFNSSDHNGLKRKGFVNYEFHHFSQVSLGRLIPLFILRMALGTSDTLRWPLHCGVWLACWTLDMLHIAPVSSPAEEDALSFHF